MKEKIDVTITATIRPEILNETLKSFVSNMFGLFILEPEMDK